MLTKGLSERCRIDKTHLGKETIMKNISKLFYAFSCFTQVGISAVTPIVLCVLASGWLRDRFALGNWVVIVGALLGICTGYVCLFRLLKTFFTEHRSNKDRKD